MQAIILAGGFGTRLLPAVADVPKPMARVSNEPFLAVLLKYAYTQGVREVVLCLHHQAELIAEYFGHSFAGLAIRYAIEDTPLGTGGAIRKAFDLCRKHEPVLVLNGDSLVMLNYREMMAQHCLHQRQMSMASVHMPVTDRYSRLTIKDEQVMQYEVVGDQDSGAISVGFYILEPSLFLDYPLPEHFSFEQDFLAQHVPAIRPYAYQHVEYFIDIGVPVDYQRACMEVPQRLEENYAV